MHEIHTSVLLLKVKQNQQVFAALIQKITSLNFCKMF